VFANGTPIDIERRKIDFLMTCTACLVCFISTVNDSNKKKKTITSGARSGHITKLKQSIILRYLWEHHALKNVNSCWNTKITFYLGTCVGQNSNLHLNAVHFFNASVEQTSVAA
jgi:hypothetical protein